VRSSRDPFDVLGVSRDADDAAIHAAYRAAVRRTHPDAGGSADDFEAVQEAYEKLRDPAHRLAGRGPATPPRKDGAGGPPRRGQATASMEDLLEEARRLEDEARTLAGKAARSRAEPDEEPQDSVGAVLRDAGEQLRHAADQSAQELRRLFGR
jgi:curved DNA-binding protein CbpA